MKFEFRLIQSLKHCIYLTYQYILELIVRLYEKTHVILQCRPVCFK